MGGEDSTALLFRARAGSADALNELYARYGPRLLSLIRLRMGGPRLRSDADSRDILQATLLKSFQHLDQLSGGGGRSLMAWLAQIAENEIRDQADRQGRQRRDRAKEEPLEPSLPVTAPMRTAVSQLIADEETERLERAIARLDEAQREAVLLRKFEELSYAEMAARMGRSEDACRMLVARAMVALTLLLQEPV